jgi:hypothetical protein
MLSRQACRLRLLSEAALHQPQKPTNQQPSISAPRPPNVGLRVAKWLQADRTQITVGRSLDCGFCVG